MDQHGEPGVRRANAWTVSTGQAARWVALQLDLRAPRTWSGPSWALLAGAVSSGYVPPNARSLVILAVAWLVGEPLLGSLLGLSVGIAKARAAGRAEALSAPSWRLPYIQPDSPGGRALNRLATWAAGAAAEWRLVEGAGRQWVLLALVTLVLAAVAGGWVLPLSAFGTAALALVAMGRSRRSQERELLGTGQFLLAWLIGGSVFGDPDYRTVMLAAAFTSIWYAWTQRPPKGYLLAAVHGLLAVLLVAVQAPITAGAVLLLGVPLFVLEPESPSSQRTYLPQTQVYLMGSMLLAAWGLGWNL